MSSFDLSGKIALVTGAPGGLGQAMAIGFAEAGADIIAVSHSESHETVKSIRALGRKAELIAVDLSNEALLDEAFAKALGFFGRIDIFVNKAG